MCSARQLQLIVYFIVNKKILYLSNRGYKEGEFSTRLGNKRVYKNTFQSQSINYKQINSKHSLYFLYFMVVRIRTPLSTI